MKDERVAVSSRSRRGREEQGGRDREEKGRARHGGEGRGRAGQGRAAPCGCVGRRAVSRVCDNQLDLFKQ